MLEEEWLSQANDPVPITVKDIGESLHRLALQGKHKHNIDCLLINSQDFIALLQEFNAEMSSTGVKRADLDPEKIDEDIKDIKIYGVKVVKSHHIKSGSIFQVFHKEALSSVTPDGQSMSGCIPNGLGDLYMPDFDELGVAPMWKYNEIKIKPIQDIKSIEPKVEKPETPLRQKRHSKTRKVEL